MNHHFYIYVLLFKYEIFFLLLAPRGAWGLCSLPPTNSDQSDHFSLASCETHWLNLFLDCSSPGGFWPALLSFPWGVHLRATLVILLGEILKTCPSHRRRRFFIAVRIGLECVLAYKSKFEMVLGQKIRQILRKHPLWIASILWKSVSTTCQHSDPYNSTDLTMLL